jgi:ABC-type dipeptide/oligopeptide/nickel transport system ATPase subunit
MIVKVEHSCNDFESYRAQRVKSLFNAESGANWQQEFNIDIEDLDWGIGLIVGTSGSGKTSLGRQFFGEDKLYDLYQGWDSTKPIVDCILPDGDFNQATGSLASVGLGDVPSWLRPFNTLSNGQQFRAGLARLVTEAPNEVVVDEFTSVVDRQIAKIGALAFAKNWRKNKNKKVVLLSCHYDIIEWLQPDWVYDVNTKVLKKKATSGSDQKSNLKYGRSTELTGNILKNIII